jgi:hydrogenase 3 maturation protease
MRSKEIDKNTKNLEELFTKVQELRRQGQKVAVIGLGSELRSDDRAGLLIVRALEAKKIPNVVAFDAGTTPENITAEISRAAPSLVIFFDAADLGEKPGTIRLVQEDQVSGVSFSTHTLPLPIVIDYLRQSVKADFAIIGIQPKSVAFGEEVSAEVEASVQSLIGLIID